MSKLASLSLFNAQFTHDPYSFYERLHQDDLIDFDQENNSYFIGKFEDVERILKSPQFTTKPLMQLEVSANIILDLLPQPRMANPSSYCETGLYTREPSSLVLHFTPHKECLVQPDSSDICTSEVEYGK